MHPFRSTTLLLVVIVLAVVGSSVAIAQTGELTVTATYTGKGTVDDTHEILVFLFDHPNPTADSRPLTVQAITKSGGTTTFKGLSTQQPLYVVMVYDEKANYDGKSGPPPDGTPIATYGKGGKPISVTPGTNVKVIASFDDSRRWGQ